MKYRVNSERVSALGKVGEVVEVEDPIQAVRLEAGGFLVRVAGGQLQTAADKLKPASESEQGSDE